MKLGGLRAVNVPSPETLADATYLARVWGNGELAQLLSDIAAASELWRTSKADSEGVVEAAKTRLALAERREAEIVALDSEATQRNSDALARIAEQQAQVDRDRRQVDEDRKAADATIAAANVKLDILARARAKLAEID